MSQPRPAIELRAGLEELARAAAPSRARTGEPLAPHTSLRVGGPADLLARAGSPAELERWLRLALERSLPVTVLGRGSNALVADQGIGGLVILNRAAEERPEGRRLTVSSGASLPALAGRLARAGLGGLEWAVGIPGSVGGAVVSNAGVHGHDMSGVVRWVEVLEPSAQLRRLPAEALELGYRTSLFRHRETGWILRVGLTFEPEDPQALLQRMREHNAYRKSTQPAEHSVGSIFKNPPGDHAGRLIQAAGLKGHRRGGALVSPVHANFIVNAGRATAGDVMDLIQEVRQVVASRFGVELELEIEPLGRWS